MALRPDHSMREQGQHEALLPKALPRGGCSVSGWAQGGRWRDERSWRLCSPLSGHVALNKSLGLAEPSFLHLQREPLPPLMQGSWEINGKLSALLPGRILLTQERGRSTSAAGAQCPVLGRQPCWLLGVPLGGWLLCSLPTQLSVPQPSAEFPQPASGLVPRTFSYTCG